MRNHNIDRGVYIHRVCGRTSIFVESEWLAVNHLLRLAPHILSKQNEGFLYTFSSPKSQRENQQ